MVKGRGNRFEGLVGERDSYVLQECNCDAWLTSRNGLMKLVQGFQDVWSISFKKVRMALKGLGGRLG